MHELSIKKGEKGVEISLDGFDLKGVSGYKLESSADRPTELSLKMIVSIAELGGNGTADNGSSNLNNCT